MLTLEQLKNAHGRRVVCEIDGDEITDAKIAVEGSDIHICQNRKGRARKINQLGYKCSWTIHTPVLTWDESQRYVTHLEFADRKIEDGLEVGDVIVSKNGEREVLGICGRVVFVSYLKNFNKTSDYDTLEELIKLGYTLKQKEEPRKLTKEQIEKELGYKFELVEE